MAMLKTILLILLVLPLMAFTVKFQPSVDNPHGYYVYYSTDNVNYDREDVGLPPIQLEEDEDGNVTKWSYATVHADIDSPVIYTYTTAYNLNVRHDNFFDEIRESEKSNYAIKFNSNVTMGD